MSPGRGPAVCRTAVAIGSRSSMQRRILEGATLAVLVLVVLFDPVLARARPPRPDEPDLTRVAIRTWCDQTVPVAVEDMTFGVRFIGASADPVTIQISPSPPWWRG